MFPRFTSFFTLIVSLGLLISSCGPVTPVAMPEANLPTSTPAVSTPEPTALPEQPVTESGPKIITGQVTYTNPFFSQGVAEPEVILEDQGGFVIRDRRFLIPVQSQVIGEITSDFFQSPFSYSLSLPAQPNGTLKDVDHDGSQDTGVMIFAVAYWTNTWGDPYLERRDQGGGGWSTAYASTRVSDDRDHYLEVTGGKYVVFSPDENQQFPSGFGEDKKLFTDDDPLMDLPSGWSVIDLDQVPFGIDRSETASIDLIEPENTAMDDFSALSYTEAFDKMVDKFKKEYAWSDLKKIDWDAKAAALRPRFEQAEKDKDKHAFALAMRDFIWSIPDTHVNFSTGALDDDFQTETAGGLGFAMSETDDGKFIATYILKDGPAEKAGIQWGSEIIMLDGKPVSEAVEAALPWSSPFSNPVIKRLQQLRYALRFKLEKKVVEIVFKNPEGSETTASLDVVPERQSFASSSFLAGQPQTSLPVEYKVLPSGFGYIKITSFLDNDVLSIQVWERAIRYFNQNQVPGVILDMRVNSGGSGWLANQMAAYFFDNETVVGNSAFYDKSSGEFYMDPGNEQRMIPPQPDLQYQGPVAVMVGPACASACEFFSYAMTINDRAAIVGQYPSEGAGGSVEQFLMPDDTSVQFTIGQAVDARGKVHIEGSGVVPTVRVPVTVENLQRQFNGLDVVLEAAEKVVGQPQGSGITPSGPPKIASVEDAENDLRGGGKFLEELAREKPEASEYSRPGTVSLTVPITTDQKTVWGYNWCAADETALAANLETITVSFDLDGTVISEDQLSTLDFDANGPKCHLIYTVLSEWPAGEHHLTIKAAFSTAINDGNSEYPAGDYIQEYAVFVKP